MGLVIFLVVVALGFDFMNGFHDAANSVATVVSTRVLTPRQAVAWAAFFNFVAAFGFGVAVAATVGKGIIDPAAATPTVVFAGLAAAIAWDVITWLYALPTSSSHALIAGFAGAAVAAVGPQAVIVSGVLKIVLFIFISPVVGLLIGVTMMTLTLIFVRHSTPAVVDSLFRRLQLVSAALYSLGHGTNDAQKTMGIISVLLFSAGYLGKTFYVPFWVVLLCHAAIALGTMFGGWRIVKTMGMRITKLQPIGGFCAETAGAITLIGAAMAGIPVSTTHTITGAIVGVGASRRLSAVRWGVARTVVWAWILTVPCTAAIAMMIVELLRMIGL
ncbi:MAG: inorganic phosphate transporter [Deltaproteobacteria bacterium]|nr:inorganic phosphate transporter [Deltaproteobacteria bacterium]MBI3386697.1 inorganic phosphate transporter [Deltaproteobacteria bacterium]